MNDMLKGVDRATLVKAIAIYFAITGVLNICGGLALLGVGALAGVGGAIGGVTLSQMGVDSLEGGAEAIEAARELGGIAVITVIGGILALITAPVLLVVAYGLFQKKAWARQGTIVVAALAIVSSVIGLFSGFNILSLIFIAVYAFCIYIFMNDEGIKQELSA